MTVETAIDVADRKRWYRAGALAALVLGICYVAIIPLYAHVGVPPNGGGEAWFKYLAGKTPFWWTILGLSVFTDFLFVPVALALYLALKGINRERDAAGDRICGAVCRLGSGNHLDALCLNPDSLP
jgi:hypothetical protein